MRSFCTLMSDCFVRLKRTDERSVHQLFDALGWEVFEQTDAFFDEACHVHDQSPLKPFNVVLSRPASSTAASRIEITHSVV